jgi:Small subunit of phenylpropionate dioxygenase
VAVNEKVLEKIALRFEIADFLYHEADLLDARHYEEWLDLLSEDYQYSVPLRLNVAFADNDTKSQTLAGSEICWFDEDKETVRKRVDQLMTGRHWAEEPVSRVSHFVTNIRIVEDNGSEVNLSSRFLVYRNRVSDETDFLVGRRNDTLRRVGESWQIVRRELLLDQTVLLAKNLSIFM